MHKRRRHLPRPLVSKHCNFTGTPVLEIADNWRDAGFREDRCFALYVSIAMLANTWHPVVFHTPNVIVSRHFPFSVVLVILTLPHKLNSGNPTQTQLDINHNCACDSPWKFHQGSLTRTLNAWLDSQVKGNITGQTGDWKNFGPKRTPDFCHQALCGLGWEQGGKMDTSTRILVKSLWSELNKKLRM